MNEHKSVLGHVISVWVLKFKEHSEVVGQGNDLVDGVGVDDGHDDVVNKHGHTQLIRLSVLHYFRAEVLDEEDKIEDEPNGKKRRHVDRQEMVGARVVGHANILKNLV